MQKIIKINNRFLFPILSSVLFSCIKTGKNQTVVCDDLKICRMFYNELTVYRKHFDFLAKDRNEIKFLIGDKNYSIKFIKHDNKDYGLNIDGAVVDEFKL